MGVLVASIASYAQTEEADSFEFKLERLGIQWAPPLENQYREVSPQSDFHESDFAIRKKKAIWKSGLFYRRWTVPSSPM